MRKATWIEIILMVIFAIILLIICGCQNPVAVKEKEADPKIETPTPSPVPTDTPVPVPTTTPSPTPVATPIPTPSPTPVPVKITIKNSVWSTVTIPPTRAAVDQDAQAYVDQYNATHFDDYLRLYQGDDAPSLDDAPPVSVYIVNPTNYHVNWFVDNVPRRLLVENADGWRQDAKGQLLFIDHVPPAPISPPQTPPYEWYSIYLVDGAGQVVQEDHCGYLQDGTFTGAWITVPEAQGGGGWRSVDHYFDTIVSAYSSEASGHPGWRVITRQLYTPPSS